MRRGNFGQESQSRPVTNTFTLGTTLGFHQLHLPPHLRAWKSDLGEAVGLRRCSCALLRPSPLTTTLVPFSRPPSTGACLALRTFQPDFVLPLPLSAIKCSTEGRIYLSKSLRALSPPYSTPLLRSPFLPPPPEPPGQRFLSSSPMQPSLQPGFFPESGNFWDWKPGLQGHRLRGRTWKTGEGWGTGALKPTHVLQGEGGTHHFNSTSQGSAVINTHLRQQGPPPNCLPRFCRKGPRASVIAQVPTSFLGEATAFRGPSSPIPRPLPPGALSQRGRNAEGLG